MHDDTSRATTYQECLIFHDVGQAPGRHAILARRAVGDWATVQYLWLLGGRCIALGPGAAVYFTRLCEPDASWLHATFLYWMQRIACPSWRYLPRTADGST